MSSGTSEFSRETIDDEIAREYGLDITVSNGGRLYKKLKELAERTGLFQYFKENGKTTLVMDEKLAKYLKKRINRELRNRPGITCRSCGKPILGEFIIHVGRHGTAFYHPRCWRQEGPR